jgi:histidine triad (HIT) family protein
MACDSIRDSAAVCYDGAAEIERSESALTDEAVTEDAADEPCVFCAVIAGDDRTAILYEDELVLAVDIPLDHPNKRGPVHFVVVPRRHVRDALALTEDDAALIARMFTTATALARQEGIAESGFRLLSNTGPDGNQTVMHLHLHCVGGRRLGPEAVWDRDEGSE